MISDNKITKPEKFSSDNVLEALKVRLYVLLLPVSDILAFVRVSFSLDLAYLELINTTVNFQMFKLVLEKAEESEIKLPTSAGSWKKQDSFRKTSTSALLTMPKPLTVWITTNCGKFLKRWEYQTTLPDF